MAYSGLRTFLYIVLACIFLYMLAVVVLSACRQCKRRLLIGHFKDCVRVLNEHDIQYVLCWGTLLGAVRGREIIANDDDIDFLVFGEEEKNRAIDALARSLGSARIRAHLPKKVFAKYTSLHADFDFATLQNGSWVRQDEMQHLGKVDGRKPLKEIRVPISMHGETTYIPLDAHAILKDLYGDTYMTPIDYGKTIGDPRHDFTALKIRRVFKKGGLYI